MPLTIDDDEHTTDLGELAYDYDDDIHDANQAGRAPADDWDEHLPPDKLWVHPGTNATPESLCDPDRFDDATNAADALVFDCPHAGCPERLRKFEPFTYADIRDLDGLTRCPECDTPILAHQQPPRDYHQSGQHTIAWGGRGQP